MWNRLFLSTLILFLALSACARGSRDANVSLLDKHGRSLEPWSGHTWFELAAARNVVFERKEYPTPARVEELRNRRLDPVLDAQKHLEGNINGTGSPISNFGALEMDEHTIFICGGIVEPAGHEVSPQTWLLDCSTNKLTIGPKMNHARCLPILTLLNNGQVLVTGGYLGHPEESEPTMASEIYDPKTKAFTECGKMCFPRAEHGVMPLNNGLVIVVGGRTTSACNRGSITGSTELLDPKKRTYIVVGSIPARTDPILIPYQKDQVVIVGGMYETDIWGDARWRRDALVFNPEHLK